jgi:hypothetical protein
MVVEPGSIPARGALEFAKLPPLPRFLLFPTNQEGGSFAAALQGASRIIRGIGILLSTLQLISILIRLSI